MYCTICMKFIAIFYIFCYFDIFFAVPPGRPRIYDGRNNNRSSVVAPYVEGSDVVLICEVDGGELFQIT